MLETSWTDHMLVTPIRSNIFPHSAMPHYKPRSTDIMTKSLSLLLNKNDNGSLLNMSRSLASFHLTGGIRLIGLTGPHAEFSFQERS